MSQPAILSIHDVEPSTLPKVLDIIDLLEDHGVAPVTLLVVPGVGWDRASLRTLRELVDRGYLLAGHGWVHQAVPPRNLYHRLHGWILSRDKAEHLSRSRQELRDLVRRCFRWFREQGLPDPVLYVPPAWAQGKLSNRDLQELPFQIYENLSGYVDAESGRLHPMPVVGYEADTLWRKWALRVVNALTLWLARVRGQPVRISIHPHDLDLLLGQDLRDLLEGSWTYLGEPEALGIVSLPRAP